MSDADVADSRNDHHRLVGESRSAGDAVNRATTALTKVAEVEGDRWLQNSRPCFTTADRLHHTADFLTDSAG